MVGQRKLLRLRACAVCGHLRGSHYVAESGGSRHRYATARRAVAGFMPCHVMLCGCAGYSDCPPDLPCPVCTRSYLTRTSLEVHLAKTHGELAPRERSVLLDMTLRTVV
jgi:hypothetical protein